MPIYRIWSRLDLSGTQVGDDGLAQLAHLDKLEDLDISAMRVNGRGLKNLKSLRKLRRLNLARCRPMADADLENLEALNHLESLQLDAPELSDAGIAHLRRIPSLKEVDLARSKITPRGVASLRAAIPGIVVSYYWRFAMSQTKSGIQFSADRLDLLFENAELAFDKQNFQSFTIGSSDFRREPHFEGNAVVGMIRLSGPNNDYFSSSSRGKTDWSIQNEDGMTRFALMCPRLGKPGTANYQFSLTNDGGTLTISGTDFDLAAAPKSLVIGADGKAKPSAAGK